MLELSLVGADRAGGVQACEQLRAGGEDDVVPLAHGAVPERLRQMALAGAAGADDQHRRAFVDVAPGGEVMDQGAVGRGQAVELEAFERLGGAEGRAAQPRAELLLLAPGDLVLDQQGEEFRVGELGIDGLAVASVERVEDAGEAQLLELRRQFGGRVHGVWLLG